MQFDISLLRLGYNLDVIFLEELEPPFQSYRETLNCIEKDYGCSKLSLSSSWEIPGEGPDPINIEESWIFQIGIDGTLYGTASYRIQTRKRNWLNASVGTISINMNYNCVFEPIPSDSPLITPLN